MKKNKLLKSLCIGLVFSSFLISSTNMVSKNVFAEQNNVDIKSNSKSEVVNFEDPVIKEAVLTQLNLILGHATDNDLTQENLDKITYLYTATVGIEPNTLNDLRHLHNLSELSIGFGAGDHYLSLSPLSGLEKLKQFRFISSQSNSAGVESFKPLKGLNLTQLLYSANRSLDNSESTLGEDTPSIRELGYENTDEKELPVDFGKMDNLPKLISLGIHNSNISKLPELSLSTGLMYLDLSENNFDYLPDLSNFKKIIDVGMIENNISSYKNLNQFDNRLIKPYIDFDHNVLTQPDNSGYKKLENGYNFIVGYGLPSQITMKNIDDQQVNSGSSIEIPISWIDERFGMSEKLTKNQEKFTNDNIEISQSNDNVSVSKDTNKINIKGLEVGSTKVTMKLNNSNISKEFTVEVK